MISRKHKCIFVHCHKCAGESIELAIFGKPDKGIGGDPFAGSPRKHFSVKRYINKYGKEFWDESYTFTFVRNPWDRLISWIKFRDKRFNRSEPIDKQKIKDEIKQIFKQQPDHRYHDMLSLEGDVSVDFIGRFENLQQDFDVVCDKIGKPRMQLPHLNKSKHKHYTEYYDEETREIVAEKYAKDIEYFGYKFGNEK